MSNLNIYFYVPNIIGYVRLLLLLLAWFCLRYPPWFITFYLSSFFLDFVDGAVARRLHQTSAFGAWLDVAIDNLGRGMLWCWLFRWGYFVSALEWCTFVCTHTAGWQWKSNYGQAPWLIKNVMADNFRSPIGMYAILSLNLLPLWFYFCHYGFYGSSIFLPMTVQYIGVAIFSAGRAVCSVVEGYCIWAHIQQMVSSEVSQKSTGLGEVQTTES
ncbi:uncharacterized protein LOC119726211 [Patiria miniata]|uniref:CDP-diacylglycerol--inositol 3-phosphatidyltransferase n=1 Tax=Patiria miniata TaxID=46514 RepID=A0A913ZQT5_PATMI|nr:uncharacterized protein LOC119726211 [Patiria miniata]